MMIAKILFFLALFIALASAASSDECKASACLDLRSLSVSCGYNIDESTSAKSYDQEICICGDSTYPRVSKECFTCIAQYNVEGYNETKWGDDCFNAFSQPKPVKSGGGSCTMGGWMVAALVVTVTGISVWV